MQRCRARLRIEMNRLVVSLGLPLGLLAVAAVGRVRPRAARPLAVRLVRFLARICGVRIEVTGGDQLRSDCQYVFVANHASPVDIPAMLLMRDDVRFLAAADLYRTPLLASAMGALQTVPIDRHRPATARRQLDDLAARPEPLCLAVFPQGRIVSATDPRPFKSGAFGLAIAAGASVVPVAIHGAARVLPPRGRLAVRPGVVTVEVLAPISTAHLTARDRRKVRDEADAVVSARLASAA